MTLVSNNDEGDYILPFKKYLNKPKKTVSFEPKIDCRFTYGRDAYDRKPIQNVEQITLRELYELTLSRIEARKSNVYYSNQAPKNQQPDVSDYLNNKEMTEENRMSIISMVEQEKINNMEVDELENRTKNTTKIKLNFDKANIINNNNINTNENNQEEIKRNVETNNNNIPYSNHPVNNIDDNESDLIIFNNDDIEPKNEIPIPRTQKSFTENNVIANDILLNDSESLAPRNNPIPHLQNPIPRMPDIDNYSDVAYDMNRSPSPPPDRNELFGMSRSPPSQGFGLSRSPSPRAFGKSRSPPSQGVGMSRSPPPQGFGMSRSPSPRAFGKSRSPPPQGVGMSRSPPPQGFSRNRSPPPQGFDRARSPPPQGGFDRARSPPPQGGFDRARSPPPQGGFDRARSPPPQSRNELHDMNNTPPPQGSNEPHIMNNTPSPQGRDESHNMNNTPPPQGHDESHNMNNNNPQQGRDESYDMNKNHPQQIHDESNNLNKTNQQDMNKTTQQDMNKTPQQGRNLDDVIKYNVNAPKSLSCPRRGTSMNKTLIKTDIQSPSDLAHYRPPIKSLAEINDPDYEKNVGNEPIPYGSNVVYEEPEVTSPNLEEAIPVYDRPLMNYRDNLMSITYSGSMNSQPEEPIIVPPQKSESVKKKEKKNNRKSIFSILKKSKSTENIKNKKERKSKSSKTNVDPNTSDSKITSSNSINDNSEFNPNNPNFNRKPMYPNFEESGINNKENKPLSSYAMKTLKLRQSDSALRLNSNNKAKTGSPLSRPKSPLAVKFNYNTNNSNNIYHHHNNINVSKLNTYVPNIPLD